MNWKKIKKWLTIIFTFYVLAGAALYFLQDKFLFHPTVVAADSTYHFNTPYKELNLKIDDNKTVNIIQFTVPDSVCRGVVLYFHGNMKNISRYEPFAANFTKHHYQVWMIDYPGFGKSTGPRDEKILYQDALRMYTIAYKNYSPDSIIIYGKSLGTGIAAQLASVRNCKKLILETPYYSVDALFSHYAFIYPVHKMANYHIPTYEYFKKIDDPVFIFHGTDDETIPFEQAEDLMKIETKCSKTLFPIAKGKHNNLNDFPEYHQKLDSLLNN